MSFFRDHIEPTQAFERFLSIIADCSEHGSPLEVSGEASLERVTYERRYLSLFAVLLGLKFCRQSDWRLNGQDLFTAISARLLLEQASRLGAGTVVEERTLSDRMTLYNLALGSTGDPSAANTSREIGTRFASLLSHQASARLEALGAATFTDAFNRVADITTKYKL